MPIENYQDELAPMLFSFVADPYEKEYDGEGCWFTDQFGNKMNLQVYGDVLKLLKNPELKIIELETDKGHESMSLYQHKEDYFILFRSKVNANGCCGWFTSYVVVPTLNDIITKIEIHLLKREEEY
jgi:hypothetical protein